MSEATIYYLDLYRRNWSAGLIYCEPCGISMPHMWVTGAAVTICPRCENKIPLKKGE